MSNKSNSDLNDTLSPANIKEHILPHYDLCSGDVTMVKFKDTDKQRAVYKVVYNSSSYCLKKVYFDESNLLFVYSCMEWLYRNNINIPKLLKTKDDGRFVTYNNMIFILTPWVLGEKCNFDNDEHLLLSAQTLAKIHRVSKNFIAIDGSANRSGLEDYHLVISKHFNQILQSANFAYNIKDKFSNILIKNLDYNLELAKRSLELSSSIVTAELSTSLCHGDYVNKNIIIDKKDVWLIDFDKCKYDFSVHDLSYFMRRLLKREGTNWNIRITENVIDNYLKYNKLSNSDFKYLLAYLAFPQKFWKISRDYYKNIRKCNKNSFIILFEKAVERSSSQLKYIDDMIIIFEKKYGVKF